MTLSLSQIDFTLPPAQIAQAPVQPRDQSRLMVAPRGSHENLAHHNFSDLPTLLRAGDLLVVNRTQVMPARLRLRHATSDKAELLCCRPLDAGPQDACIWEALGRPANALKQGRTVVTAGGRSLQVLTRKAGLVTVRSTTPLWPALQAEGEVPLPPYIERPRGPRATDAGDYQSVFAQSLGAVAAPTASLHFTPRLVRRLYEAGVQIVDLVLHVGPGTFLPIRPEHAHDVSAHAMHVEHYHIPQATVDAVLHARQQARRVIAVGTTSLRALESMAQTGTHQGASSLYIMPGFSFKWVDGLVTNFHLPRSTLLLLVCALLGHARTMHAYQEAILRNYRFYSYGDAMLII